MSFHHHDIFDSGSGNNEWLVLRWTNNHLSSQKQELQRVIVRVYS